MSDKKVKFSEVVPSFIRLHTGYGPMVDWEDLPSMLARWKEHENHPAGRYGKGGLDLDPVYQRDHVWTEAQQIAYLEYVMKGGMSGKEIYFNCPGWQSDYSGMIELVDGKQRLNAILRFVNDEIRVFGKYKFSDFERLDSALCYVVVKMNTLKTKKDIMQWYVDFNTGGTVHSEDEIGRVKNLIKNEG